MDKHMFIYTEEDFSDLKRKENPVSCYNVDKL